MEEYEKTQAIAPNVHEPERPSDRREVDAKWRKEINERMQTVEGSVVILTRHMDALNKQHAETLVVVRQTKEDTATMVTVWNEAAAAGVFLCRLARAWEFLLTKVFIPTLKYFVLPVIAVYFGYHYIVHDRQFPSWYYDLKEQINFWR